MDNTRIKALARRQHGLVTQRQATAAGLNKRMWYRRIDSGVWTELHPGVVALPGAADTRARSVAAAVLAVGHGAMASHASAAWAWTGEPPRSGEVDVIVPERARHPLLTGVNVHRPTDLADLTPSRRHGIRVTNPLRTLIDLGATVGGAPAVKAFLEQMLIDGRFAMGAARAVLARHAGPGRTGTAVLRQVLAEWSLGDRPPDSVLEVKMGDLLVRFRLPVAEFQRELRVGSRLFIPDFTFVPQRVIVEVLGWDAHGSRAAFERDPERRAILIAAGWIVLEFTWLQVVRRPGWVAAQIAAVLAQRAAA